eukprot:jgi/Galph1/2333/GphlegSOOS_G968.1
MSLELSVEDASQFPSLEELLKNTSPEVAFEKNEGEQGEEDTTESLFSRVSKKLFAKNGCFDGRKENSVSALKNNLSFYRHHALKNSIDKGRREESNNYYSRDFIVTDENFENLLQSTKELTISGKISRLKQQSSQVSSVDPRAREVVSQVKVVFEPPDFIAPYCVALDSITNEEQTVLRKFRRNRKSLLDELFNYFDKMVFCNRLASNVTCSWSKTLNTTAGKTRFERNVLQECSSEQQERIASISISVKVVDRGERLINTLAHEMCHAGQWVIDGTNRPPHGNEFKKWVEQFKRTLAFVKVNVKHSYTIRYKYIYLCETCGLEYGRHSKSIDTKVNCVEDAEDTLF